MHLYMPELIFSGFIHPCLYQVPLFDISGEKSKNCASPGKMRSKNMIDCELYLSGNQLMLPL